MKVKFEVEGEERIRQKAAALGKDADEAMDTGLGEAIALLVREIKLSVEGQRAEPRSIDTGRFRQSIHGGKLGEKTYFVADGVFYGAFLEFGTSRIHPRNHFRNSIGRNTTRMHETIVAELRKAMK